MEYMKNFENNIWKSTQLPKIDSGVQDRKNTKCLKNQGQDNLIDRHGRCRIEIPSSTLTYLEQRVKRKKWFYEGQKLNLGTLKIYYFFTQINHWYHASQPKYLKKKSFKKIGSQ